jgi:hypothetical protein
MMVKKGERLAAALELARARDPKWSMNRLARELRARGIRGSSYGSIRNYVVGNSEPPLEVLFAAAELLGVRREYLAEGQPPIIEAARGLQGKKEPARGARAGLRLVTNIQDRLPELPYPASRDVYHIVSGWWSYAVETGSLENRIEGRRSFREALGDAVAGPLESLGIDPAELPRAELEEYALAIAAALRRVLRSISPPLPVRGNEPGA